jgi:Phage integrase family
MESSSLTLPSPISERASCINDHSIRKLNWRLLHLEISKDCWGKNGRNPHDLFITHRLASLCAHPAGRQKEQVDFNLDVINVKRTKSGKGRTAPMTPRVRETLKSLCDDGDGKYVFANPETGEAITDVKHSFTSAIRAAGIEDFTFHALRHTFGTRLAASGADLVKIRELMRRVSITTTMRYMHVSDSGNRDAIARMAASYAQKNCHK